ncbi:5-formyltetrahydrofolate cyclo-ligase [Larkinella soli]|uniref:5-formyltetrahydrofolate cyclo-ligase n=1 Tax=Larkinella soli TaxID=1770527 RepID=UPI000FFCC1BF|nr:5-formyltetrahydrofolate cyclo-ligase [Larkinella soli]
MTKAELRTHYFAKRTALSETEWSTACDRINARFLSWFEGHFEPTRTDRPLVIHTFLPIVKNREIDTWRIVRALWKQFPQVQTAAPVTIIASGQMNHYRIGPDTEFNNSRYGIPEPVPDPNPLPPTALDLVLVPLHCFDRRGHRVGYGGGYYDRFLARCRPDCRKIGLSLFEPVGAIQDVDAGDVPLDGCVTPDAFHSLQINLF